MCQGPKTGTSLTISEEQKERMHTGSMMREKDSCKKARAVRTAGANPSSREDAKVKVSPEMLRDPLSTWREAKNE